MLHQNSFSKTKMFLTLTLWVVQNHHIVSFVLPKDFMGPCKFMPINLFK